MSITYIVTPNFPPEICGIGDYSALLNQNLEQRAVETRIITFSDQIHKSDKIYSIKKQDKYKLSAWMRCLAPAKDVSGIIIQYEPYSFSKAGVAFYLIYIFAALRLKGYKVSIMFHEVARRLFVTNPIHILISLNQLFIAYFLTSISTFRATSTRFNAAHLKPYKFRLLPIPSNFEVKQQLVHTESPKLRFGCFANRVDASFIPVIIQIVENDLAEVVIIGKRNMAHDQVWQSNKLRDKKGITITGTLSSDEIKQTFNRLDVFLHLEKVDQQGRGGASLKNGSLAAAFNSGLPVITSKGDMTDETLLINKKNIYFVNDPLTAQTWFNAVKQLVDDKDLRSDIRSNASEFYNKNLSWDVITDSYIEMIKSTGQ